MWDLEQEDLKGEEVLGLNLLFHNSLAHINCSAVKSQGSFGFFNL